MPSSEQPGHSDPVRAKFWQAYSSIGFPRLLAAEYNAENAPKLHCFAWNVGIRQEEPEAEPDVAALLTFDEAKRLSDVFFRAVHPEISFLDPVVYYKNVERRWNGTLEDRSYDCVICGVTGVGSYFSGAAAHPNEWKLVRMMKEVVQSSSVVYYPTTNHIAAWILRTIYQRLTTQPNAAWLSSCALTHILESTGLYKDQAAAPFCEEGGIGSAEIEYRRRLFWIGWSLNSIVSCEYGRTKIELDATCRKPQLDGNTSIPFIEIADFVRPRSMPEKREDRADMLLTMMNNLCTLTIDSDFHWLIKTDMIFSLYRRLRLLQFRLSKDSCNRIIASGLTALDAASRLASKRLAWWNILSCPFQFVCICLAIESPESFTAIKKAIDTLDDISRIFDTHMVREAVQVANSLVRLARDQRAKELRSLEDCMPQEAATPDPQVDTDITGFDNPMLWNWGDDSFAWDILLPPGDPAP